MNGNKAGGDKAPSMNLAIVTAALGLLALVFVVSCADHSREPFEAAKTEHTPGVLEHAGGRVNLYEQTEEEAQARSAGCISCHQIDHDPHPSIRSISCVDCHGGDGLARDIETAHPKPRYPEKWPSSANPKQPFTLTMDEHWDWIRFVNPGDLRVANTTCGPCHSDAVINVAKSLMTTVAHFWGVAGYANGITQQKRSVLGESYSPQGRSQMVFSGLRTEDGGWRAPTPEEVEKHSISPVIAPLPHWEIMQTGNIYRVFEQGSRLGTAALAFNGLPIPLVGLPDKLEDPGQPNNRLSDRGLGTLNRVDLAVLNLQKTRLNDPHLSFFGTNDQPGDYRSSGCTACHMVYANDRDPVHSGPWAKFGNDGLTHPDNPDPTIPKDEPGHPIEHRFSRDIPSSQCMVCHMHQPNSFVNSFYGFTMWSYDTDGTNLWPEEQQYPTAKEEHERIMHNPEGAAITGKWGDVEWLKDSAARLNPTAKHTQFADYHGHGWMFRGVFKMNRRGDLLDKDGQVVPYDDPNKFQGTVVLPHDANPYNSQVAPDHAKRAVHLKDIHAEVGMHCVDCHFKNDSHGDGTIYSEYAAQVEIRCDDCHGTIREYASLGVPTGPAASTPGHEQIRLDEKNTPFRDDNGRRVPLMEWKGGKLIQNSMVTKGLSWEVSQVKDSVTPGNPEYSAKAEYYKTIHRDNETVGVPTTEEEMKNLAHDSGGMECYACHTSWVTACWGCHLPQKANRKTDTLHFEGMTTRNYATYNPQVVRDAEFMLGVSPNVKGNTIAPVRSSSAVMISSQDGQRRQTYGQQMTMGANGMSSQLFNTHFPHTVRKTETKKCDDCHVSENNDNNAWLAQTYLLGTGTVGFMGRFVWVGAGTSGVYGVAVTEPEEPQAVIGSPLHAKAYPDFYKKHVDNDRQLSIAEHKNSANTRSLQLRGEYLYAAEGTGGFRAYDVANIHNKDFSEKFITQPVSPLGQDTHISTRFATAVAMPFNNPTTMSRIHRPENKEQTYEYKGKVQNLHELYRYAYVTDRYEGLIVIDVDSLTDYEPRNNFIKRAATFNPNGLLAGAENLTVAGTTVYVCCDAGLIAISIDDPLAPKVIGQIGAPYLNKPNSVAVQFRYAFVTDSRGINVIDITDPNNIRCVNDAFVPFKGARDIYVAKTYGYVAAGKRGLLILNLERPERPLVDRIWNADGQLTDLCQVKISMTNDSVYGYLADGVNGLRVAQMITPDDGGRSAYGFSPRPMPKLIAQYRTSGRARAISKGLDRDRAVDESGNQVTLFGLIGGRPFNKAELQRMYMKDGKVYRVSNEPKSRRAAAKESSPAPKSAEIPEKGH